MIHPRRPMQGQLAGPKTKSKRTEKYSMNQSTLNFFPARFDFIFGPTNCPWVSEDGDDITQIVWLSNILNFSILHVICIVQFTKSTPKKYGTVLTSTKYVLF